MKDNHIYIDWSHFSGIKKTLKDVDMNFCDLHAVKLVINHEKDVYQLIDENGAVFKEVLF